MLSTTHQVFLLHSCSLHNSSSSNFTRLDTTIHLIRFWINLIKLDTTLPFCCCLLIKFWRSLINLDTTVHLCCSSDSCSPHNSSSLNFNNSSSLNFNKARYYRTPVLLFILMFSPYLIKLKLNKARYYCTPLSCLHLHCMPSSIKIIFPSKSEVVFQMLLALPCILRTIHLQRYMFWRRVGNHLL